MDEEEAIVSALGEASAYGYHIESAPRPSFIVPVHDRPLTPWYPCLDTAQRYAGCLGEGCPLEVCWTGTPSVSYVAALRHRFQPADADYAAGARCLACRHVQEVSVPTIDQRRGLIHLPMLHCAQGYWQHPISAASFVRRRIPAQPHADLADCMRFEPATEPTPLVEAHRAHTSRLARRSRAQTAPRANA
jgi:hypothetical protein